MLCDDLEGGVGREGRHKRDPSPWDLPDAGIEPTSPVSPALASRFFTTEPPGKPNKSLLFAKIKRIKRKGFLFFF